MATFQKKMEYGTRKQKYPLNMTLEITPLCTLNCKMCYVRLSEAEAAERGGVLATEKWIQIVDEAIAAGVLNVLITGGEAMMHPGFFEIYAHAYDKGARISLISNATLMNDKAIEFFLNRPPENISVTIYGASKETYIRLCGADLYEVVENAVRKLSHSGLNISLMTTLTKDNINDIHKIREFARELDLKYSFNNYLGAGRNCSADCVGENEVSEEARTALMDQISEGYSLQQKVSIEAAMNKLNKQIFSNDKDAYLGMRCGAGTNSFYINWQGEMLPCTMMDMYRVDVLEKGLLQCWSEIVEYANSVPQIPECAFCSHRNCLRCVVMHYLDMQKFGVRSPRLCPVLRRQAELEVKAESNL